VKTRDALGNVSKPSEPAQVVTDASRFELLVNAFDNPRDFLADGTAGSVWDGLVGKSPNSSADVIAVKDNALRIQSTNTSWDGGGKRGPFLYKLVKGDFVAEVKIADFPGLAKHQVQGNHDAGLMVRLPTTDDKENLVQIGFFPAYDVGNMWTSLGPHGRPQRGNRLAWDAHRWLQIERRGEAFHLRTSPDGKRWFEMPGSPVVRGEFANQPLQLGFYHATYGNITGAVVFEDFRMAVRE